MSNKDILAHPLCRLSEEKRNSNIEMNGHFKTVYTVECIQNHTDKFKYIQYFYEAERKDEFPIENKPIG